MSDLDAYLTELFSLLPTEQKRSLLAFAGVMSPESAQEAVSAEPKASPETPETEQ